MNYQFGPYRLDTAERRLIGKAGGVVPLTPKAYELLWLLIRERPRVLSKEELLAHVWPDVFVAENNLATLVRDLRAALGDDAAAPVYIRTAFGFGYAFAAEAVEEGPTAPLSTPSGWVLIVSGREVPVPEGDSIVGRELPAGIVINAPSISRRHAQLRVDGLRLTCEDLGSKNGTWVGSRRVDAPIELHDGDELRFGSVLVLCRRSRGSASTETVRVADIS